MPLEIQTREPSAATRPAKSSRTETRRGTRQRLIRPLSAGTFVASLIIAACWVVVLAEGGTVLWQTNDDLRMSMRAHGYGGVTEPSPRLVYSNILWGYLVRVLPEIGGMPGYSVASFLLVGLALAGAVWLLHGIRAPIWLVLGGSLLATAARVLHPQFTVTAGLLAVVAVMAVVVWSKTGRSYHRLLVVAVMYGFLAFLIRPQMMYLIGLLTLPLLPWRDLVRARAARVGFAVFVGLTVTADVVDERAYATTGWQEFAAFNDARRPYTDYGFAGWATGHEPELVREHGLTTNDVSMVSTFFFPDPSYWTAETLNAIREDADIVEWRKHNLTLVGRAFNPLRDGMLLPFAVVAVICLLVFPSTRSSAAWGIAVTVVLGLALLGRPGVDRVFAPMVMALLVLPPLVYTGRPRPAWLLRSVALLALAGVAAMHIPKVMKLQASSSRGVHAIGAAIQEIEERFGDREPALVTWANSVSLPHVYPVEQRSDERPRLRLHSLALDSRAPATVAATEQAAGQGIMEQLPGKEGMLVLGGPNAANRYHGMVARLCLEHFGMTLMDTIIHDAGALQVRRIACRPEGGRPSDTFDARARSGRPG